MSTDAETRFSLDSRTVQSITGDERTLNKDPKVVAKGKTFFLLNSFKFNLNRFILEKETFLTKITLSQW